MFHMVKVCYPSGTEDQNSIKNQNGFMMKGLRMSFISDWKVDGAFVRPDGITKNS